MAVKKEEVLTNLTVIKRNGKKMEFKPKKIALSVPCFRRRKKQNQAAFSG